MSGFNFNIGEDMDPDWYLRLRDREMEAFGPDDPLALEALVALRYGNLDPLAALLKSGAEVPSFLRRELVFMIEGGPEQSAGWRLSLGKHPRLARKTQGRFARAWTHYREQRIAAMVADRGGFEPGQFDAAVADVTAQTGLQRSRIIAIWSAHKDAVRPPGRA